MKKLKTIKESNIKHSNYKPINPDAYKYPKDGIPTRFPTIYADFPWDIQQKGARGASAKYDTLPIEKLLKLPINDLLEDNGHFWMWMTNASLPYLPKFMEAYGLKYRSIITWVKPTLGLGLYVRNASEQLILATKGKAPIQFRSQPSWLFAPRTNLHSEKISEFYNVIARCSKGPYLELFSRGERHPGFYHWGFEAEGGSDIVLKDFPVPKYSDDAKLWLQKREAAGLKEV